MALLGMTESSFRLYQRKLSKLSKAISSYIKETAGLDSPGVIVRRSVFAVGVIDTPSVRMLAFNVAATREAFVSKLVFCGVVIDEAFVCKASPCKASCWIHGAEAASVQVG